MPRRPVFTGRVGYRVREIVLSFLAFLPQLERRWPGSYFWLGKGRYAASLRKEGKLEHTSADSYAQKGKAA
jgi:hypothetical protein